MAHGSYTGYQHMLLDLPELNKENFIDFCNDAYYHLQHFGIGLEEAKIRMAKHYEELKEELVKDQEKYEAFLYASAEEKKVLYDNYVKEITGVNERCLKNYIAEKQRYEQIKKWMSYFPSLQYVWEGFREPTFYKSEIVGYYDWVENRLNGLERSVGFREKEIKRYKDNVTDEAMRVRVFEEQKEEFLKGVV